MTKIELRELASVVRQLLPKLDAAFDVEFALLKKISHPLVESILNTLSVLALTYAFDAQLATNLFVQLENARISGVFTGHDYLGAAVRILALVAQEVLCVH